MHEALNVFLQKGTATVDIQLWHIWFFVLLISAMIFVKWARAIAIFSMLTAIVLGWQESLAAAQETVATTPVLWVAYLLIGAVMVAALAFSFCLDE